MEFGKWLKRLRKLRGLTQQDIAGILSYGASAMSNYELEKNEPSIKDLIKIIQILDVSVDYLIGASNVYWKFHESSFFTVSIV